MTSMPLFSSNDIAAEIHETALRLAPSFHPTAGDVWCAWDDLHPDRRALMVTVVDELIERNIIQHR